MFGLHDNASITRAQNDTVQLLKSVLLTESSGGGSGGGDKETTISSVAADILSKVTGRNEEDAKSCDLPVELILIVDCRCRLLFSRSLFIYLFRCLCFR